MRWTVVVVAMWGAGPTALAWSEPGGVMVTNDSGQQVEVYVDGQWRGSIRDDDQRVFSAWPGSHDVRVAWPDGTAVASDRVQLAPGRPSSMVVRPPPTTFALTNQGQAPLWVEVPGVAPFWMLPGMNQSLTLGVTGPLPVVTSVYGRGGLVPVGQLSLNPCPGHVVQAPLGFVAAAPATTVTVTNLEDHTLRVYLGGTEVAVIPVGETRTWDVRPGRTDVMIVEHGDGVLFSQAVTFDPRNDHRIRVRRGATMVETTRTVAVR
jgi:hypothetical protein